ncbi:MAG TPA: hypothetical protein DFR83_12765 [Deltaproteobacteria bacterium]|nr:hypothetical protein [Deltaproteobacteria bacterium]
MFDLATTHPNIVEHIYNSKFDEVFEYIDLMPPAELNRIRRGETVIRTTADLRGRERELAERIASRFDFPKYKPEKIVAVRMGSIQDQIWLFEIKYKQNKRKEFTEHISLAWKSSPERDEESRDMIAKAIGARPSRVSRGIGSTVAISDGSFEEAQTLRDGWSLVEAFITSEARTPVADVALDRRVYLDGSQSVRFYAEERTRLFYEVAQAAPVTPGIRVRATAQVRGENLRVEHQQREDSVCMTLSFLDGNGRPVGPARRAIARLETYPWTLIAIEETVPNAAEFVRIAFVSGVSGTTWFDAAEIEILE